MGCMGRLYRCCWGILAPRLVGGPRSVERPIRCLRIKLMVGPDSATWWDFGGRREPARSTCAAVVLHPAWISGVPAQIEFRSRNTLGNGPFSVLVLIHLGSPADVAGLARRLPRPAEMIVSIPEIFLTWPARFWSGWSSAWFGSTVCSCGPDKGGWCFCSQVSWWRWNKSRRMGLFSATPFSASTVIPPSVFLCGFFWRHLGDMEWVEGPSGSPYPRDRGPQGD